MVKCIILDIDGTLIHSYMDDETIVIHKRPFLEDFIDWCFETTDDVCIWTMGTAVWAKIVIQLALERHLSDFSQIYHSAHVFYFRGILTKPIDYITDEKDSVLIDDQRDNGLANPERHLLIRRWSGDSSDCQLLYVMIYFDYLKSRHRCVDHRDWISKISIL